MDRRTQIKYIPAEDYYKLFGLAPDASVEDIHRAFRQLAKQVHPDLNPDRKEWAHQQFQKINTAHDILTDPALRQQYDALRTYYLNQKAYIPRPPSPPPPPTYQYAPRARSNQSRAFVFVAVWLAITLCSIIGRLGSNSSSSGLDYPFSGGDSNFGGNSNVGGYYPTTDYSQLLATIMPTDSICSSDAQIADPTAYQSAKDPYIIFGTASGSDFMSYSIFIRDDYGGDNSPWITLVDSSTRPVENSYLAFVPKAKMPTLSSMYTLRLSVSHMRGLPHNCDVHILWMPN